MINQKRFAEDWDMPLNKVLLLTSLSMMYGKFNENGANGEVFPGTRAPLDKGINARLWDGAVAACSEMIFELVQPYGFTEVTCTGLGPTLKRGDHFVEVPY